jgi:hypothetical protein
MGLPALGAIGGLASSLRTTLHRAGVGGQRSIEQVAAWSDGIAEAGPWWGRPRQADQW